MRTDLQIFLLSTRCLLSKSWAFHSRRLKALYTNDVRDEEAVWNVRAVRQLGEEQFKAFL